MDLGYRLIRPFLFSMEPEKAHQRVLKLAEWIGREPILQQWAQATYSPRSNPRVAMEAFGLNFRHPLGLAAGADKDGVAALAWSALGFGFIELGTVTPGDGQPGNEGVRMARIPSQRAVINRLGFPNGGAAKLAQRLAADRPSIPVGVNIGKAKVTPNPQALADYCQALRAVFDVSDYIVVNVSSPNTPGLRELQSVSALRPLLSGIQRENEAVANIRGIPPRPLLVKVAPDLDDSEVDGLADLVLELKLQGIVATNTTMRLDLLTNPPPIAGGLSGTPLNPRALALTRRLFLRLERKVPIIGVGGIMDAEDAWRRVRAGASLLQTYTGFIYEGPGLIRSVVDGLEARLAASGLQHLADAVGADT